VERGDPSQHIHRHTERCAPLLAAYVGCMEQQAVVRRRLRYERKSTGKRVEPTERDLVWFQALHRHGPLPSSFLLAFSREMRRNETRSLERLGDLYHEANTPHGGQYLDRPSAQWSAISKFERSVYDLTPLGQRALVERGLIEQVVRAPRKLFHHSLMVACVTASIELAVKTHPGLRYISQQEILARSPNKSLAIPCRISHTNSRTGSSQVLNAALVPDAIFGIEYQDGAERRFRFFMIEADRGHEPVRRANLRETSYLRKVLQYMEVVGNGLYQAHFGMRSPVLVLTVTTNATHLHNIMAMTAEVEGAASVPYMLFRSAPAFGDQLRVPDRMHDLLTGTWLRSRLPGFRIDRPN
jgi:hypothetical protein